MNGETQRAAWWWDLRIWGAVVGMLVGIGGLAISFNSAMSETPQVDIAVEKFSLEQDDGANTDIPELLSQIEDIHGSVTGDRIIELRNQALEINFSARATEAQNKLLSEFSEQIVSSIEYFESPQMPWSAQDIEVEGTEVVWPDGTRLDLATPPARGLFPDDVLRLASSGRPMTDDALGRIRDRAHALFGEGLSQPQARSAVATQLRRVRSILADLIESKNRAIGVVLTVRNRSKLPNYIMRRALLRICRPADKSCVDLPLVGEAGTLVDSFSVRPIALRSQRLDSLQSGDRKFVETALEKEYRAIVVLQDVNLRTWDCHATFTEVTLDASMKPLVAAAEDAMGKLI